jgi:hypothetical protein
MACTRQNREQTQFPRKCETFNLKKQHKKGFIELNPLGPLSQFASLLLSV